MKTYIVYVNGWEVGKVKAGSLNAAEKKAHRIYQSEDEPPKPIHVVYTEE